MKRTMLLVLMIILIISSVSVYADDNADTGEGETGDALENKGFYRTSEYMYKVSVYVGLSDSADEFASLTSNWQLIGNQPLYVKPATFSIPSGTIGSYGTKVNYMNGQSLNPIEIDQYMTDDPPPIPITHGGNIEAVKSYFGDTNTLNLLINNFAAQAGMSKENLVSSITFDINGESVSGDPERILPEKVGGEYQNEVAWLVVYEPVVLTHLKDRSTILAFTATEYALAQKLGYFNFRGGDDGQYVSGMTHSDLPNSVFLEESWFGYPVTPALADNVYWDLDRIISGGGWGMRILRPNSEEVEENDTTYDYDYRVDTDVITSVRIFADEDVTPDNRHISDYYYDHPIENTATVIMSANGYSKSTEVVIPEGGSQLVWIKWHTPVTPSIVDIQVQVIGNSAAKIDGDYRSATITGNVMDLNENVPPNPTANDTNDGFTIPSLPVEADKSIAEWGIFDAEWDSDWVWYSDWEWESDWQYVPRYQWFNTSTGWQFLYIGHYWEDHGGWEDNGEWKDEGEWVYDYTSFYASLSASMSLVPDGQVPTAEGDTMKSGYGVNISVESNVYSNAPENHITYVQNAITHFPEFEYLTYCRLLDMTGYGDFEFQENKYSTYNNRTHFTPIWYPDAPYIVYTSIIDMWTPDGMLRMNLSDLVNINGNLYEDWHIAPLEN
ncbi:conserved exported protein of unknown function [Petrocella atlantisensis]|uniref:Uncharacterized protein n=1 Tax=Petrocella atlantisensis TaxID=2173034 RepID=A0A3P7RX21_9FIRM|nr:hypothetical protein [Petrocella atlantisensis]VDN47286.1 conserved exported protein of unknown function [Petrocella atlantisensis]